MKKMIFQILIMNLVTASALASVQILTVGQFAFVESVQIYDAHHIDEKENAYVPLTDFAPEARQVFQRFDMVQGKYARIPKTYFAQKVSTITTESGAVTQPGDTVELFYGWGSGKSWFKTTGTVTAVYENNLAVVHLLVKESGWFGTDWGAREIDEVFYISDSEKTKNLYQSFKRVEDNMKPNFYHWIPQFQRTAAIIALPIEK